MNDAPRFDPSLPQPYNENWRIAYQGTKDDTPRLSNYQTPGDRPIPIPFILDHIRFNTGQSVDTAEYPFFGLWSNTPLNQKPQTISVRGYIRGPEYIKNRNALVEALRIKTSDEHPGHLDLPLWGRFSVVVINTVIEEESSKNGQCAVSIEFVRAGVTEKTRWKYVHDTHGFDYYKKTENASLTLRDAAVSSFGKKLLTDGDNDTLASGFAKFKNRLAGVIGRIQGVQSSLNAMTNEVTNITNLLAQGIRAPKMLAEALFSAVSKIVTGVMEIKNSFDNTLSFFTIKDNQKHALMQFLSETNVSLDIAAVTVKQITTKEASENLYKTAALCAAGQLLVSLEHTTYQQTQSYWKLLEQLGDSISQEDPAVYQAIQDIRIAVGRELSAKGLDTELMKHFSLPLPLLFLAKHLGADDERIRRLNLIADSFVIEGNVVYV